MKTTAPAKITFAVALLLAVGSMLVFGPIGVFKLTQRVRPEITGGDYGSAERPVARANPMSWSPPRPLKRDSAWTYEVFTPPEIYYDERTRQFSVALRQELEPVRLSPDSGAGLELLAVRRMPFRLQLVGYIGGEGNYLGTFENDETTETFLGRAGVQLPDLGLRITGFVVRREGVSMPDGQISSQMVAFATVRDERTGAEITLTDLERRDTNELRAKLRQTANPIEVFEVSEGEVIETGGMRYVIEKLHLTPPSVEVRKETPGAPGIERQTLTVPTPFLP